MANETGVRSSYRDQLAQLRNTVMELGTFAADMLARAMRALVEQDVALGREVHRSDDVADDLTYQIERLSISLLASQQPVSGDLRGIIGGLRIAADLERIADYAKDIAKAAVAAGDDRWFEPLEEGLALMGERAEELLRLALRALADRDLELARQVAARDRELDEMWHSLRDRFTDHMKCCPEAVSQATALVLVARYLERIGDHTVNLMERLYYIETGSLELRGEANPDRTGNG